ncbi:MAG: hypothetical protein KIT16_17585, partial [Rhodospirillaceae bacterium]|nr:hypothetical protein [Rhodospirillaceae bacterium]
VAEPELAEETILEEELVLLTAPGAPALKPFLRRAAAGEIEAKILVLRAGCSYRQRLEEFLDAAGIAAPRRLEFGTVDGIVGCVGAGMGITLLPRAVAAPLAQAGRIAIHKLPPKVARVATVFVRRRDAFVSTALERFLDCARAQGAADQRTVAET